MKLDVQITDKGQMAAGPHLHVRSTGASVTIPYDVQTLKTVVEGLHSHNFCCDLPPGIRCSEMQASQTRSTGMTFLRRRRRMTTP